MNNKNLNRLIQQALAIESEEAKEAGALGYMGQIPTKERKVPQGDLVFQHVNARGWHWSEIP